MGRESGPGLQRSTNMRIIALASLLLSLITRTTGQEEEGKLRIFPSDNELVLRNFEDGTYKWVYEKDGMFRAEMEGEDGLVKGVYTVEDQEGNLETQAYISGGAQGGHRLVEFGDLGIDLPPLPYDLHPKAGQRKFPAAKEEDEEEEKENVVDIQSHPVQIQPYGTYMKEIEAVVIEAEPGYSDGGAVGALAGPRIFRQSQIDGNIYNNYNNYNLFYQYQIPLQFDSSPHGNPVPSLYLPLYNRQRQYQYTSYYPWFRK